MILKYDGDFLTAETSTARITEYIDVMEQIHETAELLNSLLTFA